MDRRDGGWLVNGAIETPLVVGAGGHFCPVARMLGAAAKSGGEGQVVAAQEIEFRMTPEQAAACPVRGEVPELYFCADLLGYAWVFRKGEYLNVGLGREDNRRLGEHVEAFCALLREKGRLPPGEMPGKFHGHAYILYGHSVRALHADGVLLIGDAAGLAYAESGEGIRPAVESGLLAARAILETRGDFAAPRLEPYVARLENRFGPRPPARGLSSWLPERLKCALAGKLLASAWFARHVVINSWFLHAGEEGLRLEA
jgi:flavin-dependent dehydrogenase